MYTAPPCHHTLPQEASLVYVYDMLKSTVVRIPRTSSEISRCQWRVHFEFRSHTRCAHKKHMDHR
jgi:hypothetical protein